jgi:tRNA (cmo5U34)-methyltransferase
MSANEIRDRVFAEPAEAVADFRFSKEVAAVFDDMLSRSVPFYAETQRMIGEMAGDFVKSGTNVYDFGCSTGTTLSLLHERVPKDVRFVGVDNSEDMLARCRERLAASGFDRPHELVCADLNNGARVENASLALMILTLQFIRPLQRERLMADIYRGLNEDGCLVLVEKVLGEDSLFNRLFIRYYYDMKRRNGYSEMEIAQKREALENVLIPYKLLENREMLLRTGYRYVDVFFKWYNFCGIVAVK